MLALLLLACTRTVPADPDTDIGGDTEDGPSRQWERVTPYPCGIDTEGFVQCWRSATWDEFVDGQRNEPDFRLLPIAPSTVPMDLVHAPTGIVARGVRRDNGESHVLGCQGPETGSYCTPPITRAYEEIGRDCGLHDGRITCWGQYSGQLPSDVRYTHLANDGGNSGGDTVVGLSDDNRLHFAYSPTADYAFPPEAEVDKLVGFNVQNACALTSGGEVLCVGSNPPSFDHPPYRMLSGGGMSVCAAREDWGIECGDGSTYDFGPLRDMSAISQLTYAPEEPPPFVPVGWEQQQQYDGVWATPQDPPHLCVVTQSNAIRCVGWLYDFEDLQAALPGALP